jgi:serine/threonine protein kinase
MSTKQKPESAAGINVAVEKMDDGVVIRELARFLTDTREQLQAVVTEAERQMSEAIRHAEASDLLPSMTRAMSRIHQRCMQQCAMLNKLWNDCDLNSRMLNDSDSSAFRNRSQLANATYVPEIPETEIVLEKEVGRGSFGRVFSARLLGLEVAVKVIAKEDKTADWSKLESMVMQEVRFMAMNRHPNILSVLGVSRSVKGFAVVTELLQGSLLDLVLNANVELTYQHYVVMFLDAARGFQWLQRKDCQTIHRDIKSANLLFWSEGGFYRLKVGDFGLSEFHNAGSVHKGAAGSPAYMAPEVLEMKIDPRLVREHSLKSDVYSFAITMYEALLRGRIDTIRNMAEAAKSVGSLSKFLARGMRPEINQSDRLKYGDLFDLIEDCWAQDPNARPSFADVGDRLCKLMITSAFDSQTMREFWTSNFGEESIINDILLATSVVRQIPLPSRDATTASAFQKATSKILQGVQSLQQLTAVGDCVSIKTLSRLVNSFSTPQNACWQTLIKEFDSAVQGRYFFGDLTRAATTSMLQGRPGTYLLRYSSGKNG